MSDLDDAAPAGVDGESGDAGGSDVAPRGYEAWTLRGVLSDYWRVVVIGGLAAIIAFGGSFVVAPTYAAGTRLLIRGRDSTVLNSTGAALGSQAGVIDSQLAAALSETQGALLQTRAVAERVVDDLDLDRKPPKTEGIVGKARKVFSNVYKRTRAILTHGFYKEAPRREAAIGAVYGGLSAKQVGDSYVLEIAATAEGPKMAAAIANSAADVLVQMSAERFQSESDAYRKFLRTQVDRAAKEATNASNAMAEYKADHGIVTSPEEDYRLSLESADTLRADLGAAEAELREAQATTASLQSDLASTSPFVTSNQEITTGRSQTRVDSQSSNPVYTQILGDLNAARARTEGLAARVGALRGALGTSEGVADTGPISQDEAELARLDLDQTIAEGTLRTLQDSYQAAAVNAQRTAVEISRLDKAGVPTYPIGPKRYLYLAIGLLIGALVGFVWSFLRAQRRMTVLTGSESRESEGTTSTGPQALEQIDLTHAERPVPTSAATAGSGRSEEEDSAL